MKLLEIVSLSLILSFIASIAQAKKNSAVDCDSFSACYKIKAELLPKGKLSDYPQYAGRDYYRSSVPKFRGGKRAFSKEVRPPGQRVFIFSPKRKAWAAYLPDGRLIGYGRASGGAHWCRDVGRACRTPRGTFRIIRKGSSKCRSSRYPKPRGGAPMPYCMFFMKAYAIHGSPNVPNYNASHGCIRVKTRAAAWSHRYFMRHGTKVIVTSY